MPVKNPQILDDNAAKQIARKVSVVSIVGNILLTVFKLIAGIIGKSSAMVSDAVHSASDVLGTVIALLGVSISRKSSDEEHQYGHERLECIAAILLAVILFATGAGIGINGIKSVISPSSLEIPGIIALIAAVVSIVVKEAMFRYTKNAADKINSNALAAEAWHHRSDALSSIGSFAGILGAKLGLPVLDPIAAIIICFCIIKVAYDIFRDSVEKLVDKSCDKETQEAIYNMILHLEGVEQIDSLSTRLFGNKIYVDVEIAADGKLSLYDSHEIAEKVHDSIEAAFPLVKHCMVHVNPYAETGRNAS